MDRCTTPFHFSLEIVAVFFLHIHFIKNNTIAVNCTTDKLHETMKLEVIVTNKKMATEPKKAF